MILLTLNNITNLNVSLQVGDLIYSKQTEVQTGAEDLQATMGGSAGNWTGAPSVVGVLDNINRLSSGVIELTVDDSAYDSNVLDFANSFIMFSKYDQSMGDVIGYYAKARFVNHSREKAEIFSVGSEITINSK
jgi:hypothetical protein